MLVPRFSLSQSVSDVNVVIKVPYVRVGDAEVVVVSYIVDGKDTIWADDDFFPTLLLDYYKQDGKNFSFYCKPYLLKLTFPEELKGSEEEDHCQAVYNAEDVSP